MHRKYDEKVPSVLRNRPKYVVQHIMKRSFPPYPSSYIQRCGSSLFTVKSSTTDEQYQVWLGSETQLPSCQCFDFKRNKLPCKHICAVVNLPDVGWESVGASFQTYPLFKLDPVVVPNILPSEEKTENIASSPRDDFVNESSENVPRVPENDCMNSSSDVKINPLKRRRQGTLSNGRNKCISTVKALHDELYMITDRDVLATIKDMVTKALSYARQNRPVENKLPLKDKTLSPRKKKSKVQNYPYKRPKNNLLLRAENKRKKKRFGVAADIREKSSKISIKNFDQKDTKEVHVVDEQAEERTPVWTMVEGIKLTEKMKQILLDPNGWLTDEHMDAASRLLKSNRADVAGLNDMVVMTHFKKTKVALATKNGQTIQCHNIGGHWVVSTCKDGQVTVYDTLGTGLNRTLAQQLIHLYRPCTGNGSLIVTVILQQLQKGLSDCGLFSIANATSLLHGKDPATIFGIKAK